MQQHTHTLNIRTGSNALDHTGSVRVGGGTLSSGSAATSSEPVNNAGTGQSGNLQPYAVANYIIKV